MNVLNLLYGNHEGNSLIPAGINAQRSPDAFLEIWQAQKNLRGAAAFGSNWRRYDALLENRPAFDKSSQGQ
jgi:hypothetical protein